MRSSNIRSNDPSLGLIVRDIEELELSLQDLGQDVEGQNPYLASLQQSIASLNTNLTALLSRLTTDEQNISSLQSQVNGISSYKSASDRVYATNLGGQAMDGSWDTAVFTATSGSLSGLNASTGVFTAPATGLYLFVCGAVVSFSGTAVYGGVSVYDGTTRYCRQIIPATVSPVDVATSVVLSLASGATAQMNVVGSASISATSVHEMSITRL